MSLAVLGRESSCRISRWPMMVHSDPMASQVPSGALGCEASLSNIAQVFLCWGLLFEQRYLHLGSESDIKWLSLYEDWLVERGSWTVISVIAYVYHCLSMFHCLNMSQYQTGFVSMSGIPKLVQTNKPPEVPSHVISLSMFVHGHVLHLHLRNPSKSIDFQSLQLICQIFTDISDVNHSDFLCQMFLAYSK